MWKEGRNLSWENALIRMACGQGCRAFSLLMVDGGGLSLEHVVLGAMKK